jgi:hypothetical protein
MWSFRWLPDAGTGLKIYTWPRYDPFWEDVKRAMSFGTIAVACKVERK